MLVDLEPDREKCPVGHCGYPRDKHHWVDTFCFEGREHVPATRWMCPNGGGAMTTRVSGNMRFRPEWLQIYS